MFSNTQEFVNNQLPKRFSESADTGVTMNFPPNGIRLNEGRLLHFHLFYLQINFYQQTKPLRFLINPQMPGFLKKFSTDYY